MSQNGQTHFKHLVANARIQILKSDSLLPKKISLFASMMKNALYFILKVYFVLKILKFLS